MALTRRAYAWMLHYDDPLEASERTAAVWALMEGWTERWPKVFSSVWVNGGAFGLIQCGVVVTRRDQWECHRKAVRLSKALAGVSGKAPRELSDPDPAKLDPHTHRGDRRFLAPKYQESSHGPDQATGDTGQPLSADA